MEYKDGNGKKHTKSVKTDNKTFPFYGEDEGDDKKSFDKTVQWMKDRIKADSKYWDEEITEYGEDIAPEANENNFG